MNITIICPDRRSTVFDLDHLVRPLFVGCPPLASRRPFRVSLGQLSRAMPTLKKRAWHLAPPPADDGRGDKEGARDKEAWVCRATGEVFDDYEWVAR